MIKLEFPYHVRFIYQYLTLVKKTSKYPKLCKLAAQTNKNITLVEGNRSWDYWIRPTAVNLSEPPGNSVVNHPLALVDTEGCALRIFLADQVAQKSKMGEMN